MINEAYVEAYFLKVDSLFAEALNIKTYLIIIKQNQILKKKL